MTTPRPRDTAAGPPRGRGPAWERPGARPASSSCHRDGEQIADAALGADELRLLRVRLDLAAQAQDQHVDRAVEHLGLEAARLLEQLVAGPDALRLAHEGFEEAVLGLRQRTGRAVFVDQLALGQV